MTFGLIILVFMFLLFLTLPFHHKVYEMDFGVEVGTFGFFLRAYTLIGWILFFTLLAMCGTGIWFHVKLVPGLALIGSIEALLFNFLLTFFFESYVHVKYKKGSSDEGFSNYTHLRYSIILSLGVSSILSFIIGAFFLYSELIRG